MNRWFRLAGALACAAIWASPGFAEPGSKCAVSGINGKVEAAGGFILSEDTDGGRGHGAASLSLPLGCWVGMQIDGTGGVLDNEGTGGAAAHLFTRDPSLYLAGLYGEYEAIGANNVARAGAEGELYLSQFTLSGLAGYDYSEKTGNGALLVGQAKYYITDDLEIHAGAEHFLNVTAGTFGAEWHLAGLGVPLPLSVFVDGGAGSNDYVTTFAGVRLYFSGESKSLIRRHREDDPINWTNHLKTLVKKNHHDDGEDDDQAPAPD